jgi:hypothetical protein
MTENVHWFPVYPLLVLTASNLKAKKQGNIDGEYLRTATKLESEEQCQAFCGSWQHLQKQYIIIFYVVLTHFSATSIYKLIGYTVRTIVIKCLLFRRTEC